MIRLIILLIGALLVYFNYKKNQLVSSSTLWVFCYILIFVLFPWSYGDDDYKHCFEIDICALVGITGFAIGQLAFGNVSLRSNSNRTTRWHALPCFGISCKLFWTFAIVAFTFIIVNSGSDVVYRLIQGAVTSKELVLQSDGALETSSFMVHLQTPFLLSMWITASNTRQKRMAMFGLLVFVCNTVLFGFTRIHLLCLLAMILVHESRRWNKRRQVTILSISMVALLFFMVLMNYIRCFGLNNEVTFSELFSIDYIFESSDFGASYVWFDKLLSQDSPYLNWVVYLKPLYAFVPRSIWPEKPEQTSMQVLRILDPSLASTGYSTAGYSVIGEGYVMMGGLGIFLFPIVWGMVCAVMDRNYYKRIREGHIINIDNLFYYVFSVFIIISGQRGDWNQYLVIVLWFYMVPLYIVAHFFPYKKSAPAVKERTNKSIGAYEI